MSKLLCNVLKISGGANAPPGCAPGSGDDSEAEYLFSAKAFSSQAQFKKGYLVGR